MQMQIQMQTQRLTAISVEPENSFKIRHKHRNKKYKTTFTTFIIFTILQTPNETLAICPPLERFKWVGEPD